MPIGSSKLGVLGAGLVPGGTETFNAPGTFSIPPGVKKVSITGKGATGNPGNSGTAGNPGNFGTGGTGGGGSGSSVPFNSPVFPNCTKERILGGMGGRRFNAIPLGIGNTSRGGTRGGGGPIPCGPFPGPFFPLYPVAQKPCWYSGSVTGGTGPSGNTGNAGSAGSAGSAGNAGQTSSGLGNNFAGGAGGNAGAAGSAGTAGSGGQGGSGGTFSCNATSPGGAGGNGGGSGGSSGNNLAPTPQCSRLYAGTGGGGAGVTNDGGNGCSGGPFQSPNFPPDAYSYLGGAGGNTSGFCFPYACPYGQPGTINSLGGRISNSMTGGRGSNTRCVDISGSTGASQFDINFGCCAPRFQGRPFTTSSRNVGNPGPLQNLAITDPAFRSGTGGGTGAPRPANPSPNGRAGSGGGGGGRGNAGNPGGCGGGGNWRSSQSNYIQLRTGHAGFYSTNHSRISRRAGHHFLESSVAARPAGSGRTHLSFPV